MALYRNIAGAEQLGLLLQAVEPMDISPYEGGGNTVFYDPGTWEIRDTQTVDPATLAPVPSITPSQPLIPQTATDVTATTSTPLPVAQSEVDWLPLITIAGLFVTIFKGEQVFKNKRKLAFIGGLGALYYEFARKEKVG